VIYKADIYKSELEVRFVAFPAAECDEVFSGYQPGQLVERYSGC